MSQYTCHLTGCGTIVTLKGDGAAFSEKQGDTKVFFCSLEHWAEFNNRKKDAEQVSKVVPFASCSEGIGPEVLE